MQINFFQVGCKTESNIDSFGLCDDPPPAKNPAYIDENDTSKWIAVISNPNKTKVIFYAIDNCVKILRLNDEKENRCDGVLVFDSNLIFVELKDRAYGGWLGGACNQLKKSILIFFKNYNRLDFNNIKAYVSNKQRPIAKSNYTTIIEKFKDATGLNLIVQQKIIV